MIAARTGKLAYSYGRPAPGVLAVRTSFLADALMRPAPRLQQLSTLAH